jgi:hypothetical protein
MEGKGSRAFLMKTSKLVDCCRDSPAKGKSFLVLFFKKELLPSSRHCDCIHGNL